MNKQRKVLQQALEAFGSTNLATHVAAIDAIRAALAEHTPQQEGHKRTVTYVCPVCAASLEKQE